MALQQMFGKLDDIASFTKGRQCNLNAFQAVIKIGAKPSFLDFILQVSMGCRDDSYIDGLASGASDGGDRPFLQNPEQSRLRAQRHVADFIQKNRSLMSRLEFPLISFPIGPRKSAPLITEQFAFHQVVGYCAAIHGYEGLIRT